MARQGSVHLQVEKLALIFYCFKKSADLITGAFFTTCLFCFFPSSGLFPLLSHAAMAVKPVLLTLYERYYLPLQRALLPSLQAFITGLLPGLEEGLEVNDRYTAHTVFVKRKKELIRNHSCVLVLFF